MTFSCIISLLGEELLSILSVLLFNKDRFMHAEKHLKIIIKPVKGEVKKPGRTFSLCMCPAVLFFVLFCVQ